MRVVPDYRVLSKKSCDFFYYGSSDHQWASSNKRERLFIG
jgi:hypothetical protein